MIRKIVSLFVLGLLCAFYSYAGLIPLPKDTNLELLSNVSIVEAYDVTFDRNATSLCTDLLVFRCYALKFGYGIEKSRWVMGAGVDVNGFAKELKSWTSWDLTVPILDQLGIKAVVLATYSPTELPSWSFQAGATWNIIKF